MRTTQKIKSWGYEDYSKDLLNWRLVRLESVKFTLFTLWTSMLLCSLQDKTSKKTQGTIVSKREVKHFFEIDQLAIIQFVLLRSTLYGLYWLKLCGCSSAVRLCRRVTCEVGWGTGKVGWGTGRDSWGQPRVGEACPFLLSLYSSTTLLLSRLSSEKRGTLAVFVIPILQQQQR